MSNLEAMKNQLPKVISLFAQKKQIKYKREHWRVYSQEHRHPMFWQYSRNKSCNITHSSAVSETGSVNVGHVFSGLKMPTTARACDKTDMTESSTWQYHGWIVNTMDFNKKGKRTHTHTKGFTVLRISFKYKSTTCHKNRYKFRHISCNQPFLCVFRLWKWKY